MQASPANLIHLLVAALALVPLLSGMGCAANQKNVEAEAEQRLFSDVTHKGNIDEAMRSKIIRYRFVTMNLHMITGTEKTNQLRSNYTSTLQLNLFDDAIFMAVLDRREVLSETSVVWLPHLQGCHDRQERLSLSVSA